MEMYDSYWNEYGFDENPFAGNLYAEIEWLRRELRLKDEEIEGLQEQIRQCTERKPVGRPAKYGEYYIQIKCLYSKYGSATRVAQILKKRGINISVRQINNIVKK